MASVTLRKALRLKKQIEAGLRVASAAPQVAIDIDDPKNSGDMASILASEEAQYLAAVEKQVRLSDILSDVRRKIEAANGNGVNEILSKVGHIDRQIAIYKPIADAKPVNADVVQAKLARKREAAKTPAAPATGYGALRQEDGSILNVNPLSAATINAYKAKLVELRKRKEALEDQRLSLNNQDSLAIEIGDDDLLFLSELEIV